MIKDNTKNHVVFRRFRETVSNRTQRGNGDESSNAKVIYKFSHEHLEEVLIVTLELNGIRAGSISLSEGQEINTEKAPLTFNPDWQTYTLTDQNFIMITGHSNRIGSYAVTIVPI